MKIRLTRLIMVACVFVLLLAGCTENSHSTISYYNLSNRESIISQYASDWFGIYDFSFQEDVQGAALYLDRWQAGRMVHSDLIASGSTVYLNACYIAVKSLVDKNNQCIGQQWDIRPMHMDEIDQQGPIAIKFPNDKKFDFSDVRFLGGDGPKQNRLRPNNNYVLALQSYRFTETDEASLTCEMLMKEPERIKKSDSVVLLRLQTFATAEEARSVK